MIEDNAMNPAMNTSTWDEQINRVIAKKLLRAAKQDTWQW